MTLEEARAWFEANEERLRQQSANMQDPPAELTPDGILLGPTHELESRRLVQEVAESGKYEE